MVTPQFCEIGTGYVRVGVIMCVCGRREKGGERGRKGRGEGGEKGGWRERREREEGRSEPLMVDKFKELQYINLAEI